MRVHRTYRAGVAEMASALLLMLAFVAIAPQLTTSQDDEASSESEPAATATVSVDSQKTSAAASGSAVEDLQLAHAASDPVPWHGWASLDGKRLEAASDHEAVRVVAARNADGVAVAVSNPGSAPALLRLKVRLPAGRYTIERLVFGRDGSRIERLQSSALSEPGSIQKPGYLYGGTGAVYRFVNYASVAASTYRRAVQQARNFRSVSSRQSALMVTALRECPWMLTRANRLLSAEDPVGALKPIHRALLGVRHAQAICGNTPASGAAARRLLDRIALELDTLENALGECSVAALGLLPSAVTEMTDGRLHVKVRVRNAGPHVVSAVKLWVTGPQGCSVEPSLQAVFDALRPGQSAMAEFTASSRGDEATDGSLPIVPSDMYGHLSYIRGQAPAHVRIAVR